MNLGSAHFWFSLVLVLTLAVGVRFYRLGADDYWLDELHSLSNSAATRATFEDFPFGEIFTHRPRGTQLGRESNLDNVWHGMRDDTHPPLFFGLLNLWRRAVGDNEAATRALAATCSVISIGVIALLFRRLGRPFVGILAACLLTLAFGHVHMAQQNRQYSLALMFTALSYLALTVAEDREAACHCFLSSADRLRDPSWKRVLAWSLYALSLCLSLLTHYLTVIALAGQVIYAAVRFRRGTLWHWIATGAAAVALTVVLWGDALPHQRSMIANQPWLNDSVEGHAYRTLMRFVDLPLRMLFQLPAFRIEPWRFAGGLLLLGVGTFAAWRKPCRDTLLMIAWFLFPCVALVIADIAFGKQMLSHIRYPVVAIPGLAGLLALAIAQLRPALRYVAAVALCAAMLGTLSFPTTSNPDARLAVAELRSRVAPEDLIIFDAIGWPEIWVPHFYAPMEFYMGVSDGGDWPNPMLLLRDPPADALVEQISAFDRIWVVSPRVDESNRPIIPNPSPVTHALKANSGRIWDIGWIYLFERAQPERLE